MSKDVAREKILSKTTDLLQAASESLVNRPSDGFLAGRNTEITLGGREYVATVTLTLQSKE